MHRSDETLGTEVLFGLYYLLLVYKRNETIY